MALSAAIAGRLWEQGHPLALVALVAIVVGAVGGALNAGLSLVGRIHPIVVTLGTMSVYRGLTLWWLGGEVHLAGSEREWIVAEVLGVPVIVWLALALAGLTSLALNFTLPGRALYALGSNPAAAYRVGIEHSRVWLGAFSLQGALVGLSAFLFLARTGSLQSTSHEGMTLEAIAAAVVGGVAITGGRGSVWRVVVGCLLLVSLGSVCTFLELSARYQRGLVGAVLVVAVVVDALARRREP
jgi:rhamnose transport system permease protein